MLTSKTMLNGKKTSHLLGKAHALLAEVIQAGEVAVDATMGNGHDTLFLSRCVGKDGRVIGFDVQAKAVESTRKRLMDAHINESCFQLHQKSHDRMAESVLVQGEVAAVVFNLGYLPGADKSIVTNVHTTMDALTQSMACLRVGGLLSVMCYPGHAGGDVEAESVLHWMEQLDGGGADVTCYQRDRGGEKAPFLLVALKNG